MTFIIYWLAVVVRMNMAAFGFSIIFGSARLMALRMYPFCFFCFGAASFFASFASFAVFAGFILWSVDFTIMNLCERE